MQSELVKLQEKMSTLLNMSDLEDVCFVLGIDYQDLRHDTKPHMVRDLINYMGRQEKLPKLVALLRQKRPRATWPDVTHLDLAPAQFDIPPQATTIIQGDVHMGDTFNMSGDFRGAILNIKSTLTNVQQQVGGMQQGSTDQKEELKKQLEELKEAIAKIPEPQAAPVAEDAEAVAEMSKQLVEMADKEKPNKRLIQITGEGLKDAAENLATVAPLVLTIATRVVETITKMVGG